MMLKSALFTLLSLSLLLAGEAKQYGKKLTLEKTTPIEAIDKAPESFVGKTVLVEGTVVDVCKKRGCWIKVVDDKSGSSLLVKVKDGEIVFPLEARGKTARVEGVFQKLESTMEETVEHAKKACKLEGKEFDPATVTKPDVSYRLKALGAVIK